MGSVFEIQIIPIHHQLYMRWICWKKRLVVSLGWLGWRNSWDEWDEWMELIDEWIGSVSCSVRLDWMLFKNNLE